MPNYPIFRILLAIGLCVGAGSTPASAQVQFEQVQTTVGLHYNVLYGPTFDFSADAPALAQMKRVMQRNMGNGAAVGDYDNDGDPDIYVLGQTDFPNRLYRNDLESRGRKFTNIAAIAGVGDTGFGRSAQFADLNNDGWDDLILLNDDVAGGPHSPSRIYRNNANGLFSDVTAGSSFAPTGLIKGGMCLGDYNGDGLLDIYVGLWLMEVGEGVPNFSGENKLYRNLGDFQFEDVTAETGLSGLQRDSFSCVFADFDNDGDADLYVAIDHTSDACYRNNGNGTFTDVTVAVGAKHTGNDMGISVVDFDDDGDLDVYSTNITDAAGIFGTTQYNTLLVNQLSESGQWAFLDQAASHGVRDTYWGWGTEFVDVDNDGDLDLYAVNGFDEFVTPFSPGLADTPEVLFINQGDGSFHKAVGVGADFVSDARAAIAFDYNLDGLQDMLVTSIIDPLVLLQNQSDSGASVRIELVGRCGQNSDAVGGRIHVTTEDKTRMRDVLAGGSYLSGRPFEQHFGLGKATQVDQLRVVFPSGFEFIRKIPLIVNRRVAVFHETDSEPGRMMVSRDLRDFGAFQRCMGLSYDAGSECEPLDTDGGQDGVIGHDDLSWFVTAMNWDFLRCVE